MCCGYCSGTGSKVPLGHQPSSPSVPCSGTVMTIFITWPPVSASLKPLSPHPPTHQHQHQYNPRQPDPVELGEDHRFTPGGEIDLLLEGGDPDQLAGGEETLVTPWPEPTYPLAAGGERVEQAVGEQRDQSGGGMLGVFLWTGRLVSICGSKRLPWVSILRIIHHL